MATVQPARGNPLGRARANEVQELGPVARGRRGVAAPALFCLTGGFAPRILHAGRRPRQADRGRPGRPRRREQDDDPRAHAQPGRLGVRSPLDRLGGQAPGSASARHSRKSKNTAVHGPRRGRKCHGQARLGEVRCQVIACARRTGCSSGLRPAQSNHNLGRPSRVAEGPIWGQKKSRFVSGSPAGARLTNYRAAVAFGSPGYWEAERVLAADGADTTTFQDLKLLHPEDKRGHSSIAQATGTW
jgi:hypothetical protein